MKLLSFAQSGSNRCPSGRYPSVLKQKGPNGAESITAHSPWTARPSQIILLLAGFVAWIIAIALTVDGKSDAVAAAFIPVGMLLIGAAAFFPRLREFGPQGVKLDSAEAVRELGNRLPPPPGDASPTGERGRLLDVLDDYLSELELKTAEGISEKETSVVLEDSVARGVQSYEKAVDLETVARTWLKEQGFQPMTTLPTVTGVEVDLIARRQDGAIALVELQDRPSVPELSSRIMKGVAWAHQHWRADVVCPFLLLDARPSNSFLDRLRQAGISFVFVDRESGQIEQLIRSQEWQRYVA